MVVGTKDASRNLRVFLCYSKSDRLAIRRLYQRLKDDKIETWFDEEDLLPGQEWKYEIPEAVKASHVIIINLSRASLTKKGYVQKEIKLAIDTYQEQPPNSIYVIPLKLEEIADDAIPENLLGFQWLNYYEDNDKGYYKLKESLIHRAKQLGVALNLELDNSSQVVPLIATPGRKQSGLNAVLTNKTVMGEKEVPRSKVKENLIDLVLYIITSVITITNIGALLNLLTNQLNLDTYWTLFLLILGLFYIIVFGFFNSIGKNKIDNRGKVGLITTGLLLLILFAGVLIVNLKQPSTIPTPVKISFEDEFNPEPKSDWVLLDAKDPGQRRNNNYVFHTLFKYGETNYQNYRVELVTVGSVNTGLDLYVSGDDNNFQGSNSIRLGYSTENNSCYLTYIGYIRNSIEVIKDDNKKIPLCSSITNTGLFKFSAEVKNGEISVFDSDNKKVSITNAKLPPGINSGKVVLSLGIRYDDPISGIVSFKITSI